MKMIPNAYACITQSALFALRQVLASTCTITYIRCNEPTLKLMQCSTMPECVSMTRSITNLA